MKTKIITMLLCCMMLLASCSTNSFTAQNDNTQISIKGSYITVNGETYNYNTMFDDNINFIDLTVFNGQFVGIAKNKKDGKTKIVTSIAGTVWSDTTPDYFADSDIDPLSLTYLKAFAVSDQCFLVSTNGTLVTLTACAKCTSAKKVAEFEMTDAVLNGNTLSLIGENESSEINLSELRQTNIQKDAVFELTKKGAYLIDVRNADEFMADTIDGAINVPLDTFEEWIKTKDTNDTFILFCQKGIKSAKALELALNNGYEKSYLAGAIDNLK